MYAVVRIAGFQYLVRPGHTVTVPRLDAAPGSKVRFEDVLFVRTDDRVVAGRPTVAGGYVEAEIVDHPRARKVIIYKFRRREKYRRKRGHRQPMTRVRIAAIGGGT